MKKIHISYLISRILKIRQNSYFISHISYFVIVVFLFAVILFINYYDVLKFHYFVPPGSDPVTHVTIAKEILATGKSLNTGYPPGFHYIVAELSKISGTDPIQTTVYFYPFLMFLSALAVYLFARQFFGKWAALLTLLIFGFISPQPRQTLWDGGFPNVITADCIMIFGFLFFLRAYKYEKWRDVILAGIILGAVPAFHHLSSYLMVFLLILFTPALLLFSLIIKDNFKKKARVLIAALTIAFIIGVYPAYTYFGKGYLIQIAGSFIAHAASLKGFIWRSTSFMGDAPPFDISWYALVVSPYLWFLGLLSIPFLLKRFIKDKKAEYLFMFVWMIGGIIISRPYFFSPLPGRFTRELTIPLSICSAVFIRESVGFFKNFWPRAILIILIAIFLFKGLQGIPNWVGKYNPMVFVNSTDKQALDWVKENTSKEAKIAVAPGNCWFTLLTQRNNQNIGTNFDTINQYDYLYINRWQNDWMWGFDPTPFIKIRNEAASRSDLQLIKTFREDANRPEENENGIAIYRVKK